MLKLFSLLLLSFAMTSANCIPVVQKDVIITKNSIHQNGQFRCIEEDKYLYNYLINYLYHTGSVEEGINTYSYSLNPESYQPKGSCNFSKIDDLIIELTLSSLISYNNPALLRVYNYSYNVLRITDGLAGLTFVN